MTDLREIPTRQLREAADAWRRSDRGVWGRQMNGDLYEKIDDLISEIERLRDKD